MWLREDESREGEGTRGYRVEDWWHSNESRDLKGSFERVKRATLGSCLGELFGELLWYDLIVHSAGYLIHRK